MSKRITLIYLLMSVVLVSTGQQADNKVELKNYTRMGFGIGSKQGFMSFNTALIGSKKGSYDIGIGTGIEYFNRGQGLISLTQIPVFWMNRIRIGSGNISLILDPGFMIPTNGYYTSDLTGVDEKVRYKSSDFKPSVFYNVGLAFYNKAENVSFELICRNQSTGVTYPIDERKWMFGLNLGFKL